jgi:hypothetical protein
MIRDHQDTTARYDTLGESPHLVAIFQNDSTASGTFGTSWRNVQGTFGTSWRNLPVTLRSELCVHAFSSKAGDFVLSVNQGKLKHLHIMDYRH